MKSIRRHLLLSLLAVLLVLTAIMIGIAYVNTTSELREAFTNNLQSMAVIIKGQAFSSTAPQGVSDMDTGELEESYVIQVWDGKGALLRSSRPDLALSLQSHDGFNQIRYAKQLWDVYTLKAAQSGYVQIAQPHEIVATMVGESALHALLPFGILFVLLAVAGWIIVGRSLSPLHRLSQTIRTWSTDNMQPFEIADVPEEIVPLVSALNALLSKLDKALSMQRQFTADAAHELRTPLTAIKLQLDNLVRAQTEGARQEAISKLSEGIDRSIHLAAQLLAASRSMAVKTTNDFQTVKLDEVVRSSIASFVPLASAKQIDVSYENSTECAIHGDEDGLRVMVNNLLDNAIRYTPPRGKIAVRLSKEINWVIFKISDTGPGIPTNERSKVFQRFYRIPGTASTGSGLGLSIVKSVADSHDSNVAIIDSPSGQGTTIRILFRALAA
jgi:two-component system, OmpR family, sensor kinase